MLEAAYAGDLNTRRESLYPVDGQGEARVVGQETNASAGDIMTHRTVPSLYERYLTNHHGHGAMEHHLELTGHDFENEGKDPILGVRFIIVISYLFIYFPLPQ